LQSYHCIHTLRQDAVSQYATCDAPIREACFHWFDFAAYLTELEGFLSAYGPWLVAADPDGPTLRARLARLVASCAEVFATTAADPGRGRFPLRMCRVDPNLANAVWGADSRLRWVDWEYSGWGDPALDLAELRWHAAVCGLDEVEHEWLRENYCRPDDDPAFDARLAVWDRLLVTRWPLLILRTLWSAHNGPDRLRLTRPAWQPDELRDRLVHFIERAENLKRSRHVGAMHASPPRHERRPLCQQQTRTPVRSPGSASSLSSFAWSSPKS
jgi:thiamine kinase-like enzyme